MRFPQPAAVTRPGPGTGRFCSRRCRCRLRAGRGRVRQHRCTGHGRVQRARRVSEFGSGTTSAAKISLTVRFSGSATTAPRHYTLRCDRPAAPFAIAAAACAKLLKGTSLFAALPARTSCAR